jgi:hypothetical protein
MFLRYYQAQTPLKTGTESPQELMTNDSINRV